MRLVSVLAFVVLAACGGAQDPAPTTTADQPVSSTEPTAAEPAAAAPTGAVDCAMEIALTCQAGEADGCLSGVTTHHACVAEGATAGAPCEQEIALECPEGFVDACLAPTRLAANHVCVRQ